MSESFTTAFGDTIPFVPGYFERNKRYAYYAKGTTLHSGLTVKDGPALDTATPLKDFVQFSNLLHFMARYGLLDRKRARGIDLGGAEGTNIRLFKAAGVIEHATNLDIDDYRPVADDAYFESFAERFLQGPKPIKPVLEQAVMTAKQVFDYFPEQPGWNVGLLANPTGSMKLDAYLHMDLLDAPGSYDLVSSFCCFDYLDLNKAFAKVRSLLNPGGLFVGVLEYWWWAVNSTGILGHFPYAGTRLSFEDLQRYYAQHHPDLTENLYYKYHYFHEGKHHPTIDDILDIANANGLKPVAVERIVPKRHGRLPDCPPAIFRAAWFDHREVLRDVRHLNPRVTTEDLFTSAVKLALVPA